VFVWNSDSCKVQVSNISPSQSLQWYGPYSPVFFHCLLCRVTLHKEGGAFLLCDCALKLISASFDVSANVYLNSFPFQLSQKKVKTFVQANLERKI